MRAAEMLRTGRLVAFPTETVYGLGANALDATAVASIFTAKGRPASNPIIVHIAAVEEARGLTRTWPEPADVLAKQFWPGPLTLVLPRSTRVPSIVTAGGDSVALRIPANPIALELIRTAGVPVAAPSANPSEGISPTTAQHVLAGLNGKVELILDGGPSDGGIESTVVDLRDPGNLRVLRYGLISVDDLSSALGAPVTASDALTGADEISASPGQLLRHYAPRTRLEIATDSGWSRVERLLEAGRKAGWMPRGIAAAAQHAHARLVIRTMPANADLYATKLYSTLHELDALGLDRIVVGDVPTSDTWLAINDRLKRASTPTRGL